MPSTSSPPSVTARTRNFWTRHAQLLAALFVVASSALAAGPDNWVEWVLWGTTVVSHETARFVLLGLAVIIAAAVIWPLLRPSRDT
jgi:hypothetical protein